MATGAQAGAGVAGAGVAGAGDGRAALAALDVAVAKVVQRPMDGVEDDLLVAEMTALQSVRRRVDARIARTTSELTRRRADAVRADGGDDRAVDRAQRQARGAVADALSLPPADVRRAQRVGDRLDATPAAAAAFDAGDLSDRHLDVLDRTLASLSGEVRAAAEAELVAVGRGLSRVEFADACTRLLARLDRAAAVRAEQRRHGRRTASTFKADDGMLRLSGAFAGLQAEVVATAIHAYRRADREGEHRTSQQRTADAVVAALQAALDQHAALDRGGAPVRHGVVPHVVVTVDLDTLCDRDGNVGIAEADWTGPIVWDAIRGHLDDAGLSFVTIGRRIPIQVTAETRNVPVGVYKAIALRDGGCIHETCDMPAQWCQVMHLSVAYRGGGRLAMSNAALGCTTHHRNYDHGRLALHWTNGCPVLRPPPPT